MGVLPIGTGWGTPLCQDWMKYPLLGLDGGTSIVTGWGTPIGTGWVPPCVRTGWSTLCSDWMGVFPLWLDGVPHPADSDWGVPHLVDVGDTLGYPIRTGWGTSPSGLDGVPLCWDRMGIPPSGLVVYPPIGTGWDIPCWDWMGVHPPCWDWMGLLPIGTGWGTLLSGLDGVPQFPPFWLDGGSPPHQETKQQSEHLLRNGRYASCVHAGGLSSWVQ